MTRPQAKLAGLLLLGTFAGSASWADGRAVSVDGAGHQPLKGRVVSFESTESGDLAVLLEANGARFPLSFHGLKPRDLPANRCKGLSITPQNWPDGPGLLASFFDSDETLVAFVGINQRLGIHFLGPWSAVSGSKDSITVAAENQKSRDIKAGKPQAWEAEGTVWLMDLRQTRPGPVPQARGSDVPGFRYSFVLVAREKV